MQKFTESFVGKGSGRGGGGERRSTDNVTSANPGEWRLTETVVLRSRSRLGIGPHVVRTFHKCVGQKSDIIAY